MRIAYLTQSYPPMISGASLVVETLAHNMAQRGHQVLVLAASDRAYSYKVMDRDLTVLRLTSLHNRLRVGQRFLFFPHHSVMKVLHNFKPELIHAHDPLQIGLLGARAAKRHHVPSLVTIHQVPSFAVGYLPRPFQRPTETLLWLYARWLASQFTCIIAPTETISRQLAQRLQRPVDAISNGIDLEIFHPLLPGEDELLIRRRLHLPPEVPILLHVGRLDADKRVDRIIHAAATLLDAQDAHLLIVGDGTQKTSLVHLCKKMGISERVHFTGYISVKEGLPEVYRIARLFVTASEIETQGIVLLEAAASGLPIAAVRATCIPEIVHHGINGFLAEAGDTAGLSQSMATLVRNKAIALDMGKASRELAQLHEIRLSMDAHETRYRQLILQGAVIKPPETPERAMQPITPGR